MAEAIDDLSDKEKETLRLIVRGHDAKSAANALSLSVHTINERLRSARRKLDVTSSREAARLLFEAEAETPKNLGYKALGDAQAAPSRDDPPITRQGRSPALWIGGFLIMSATALILAIAMSGTTPWDQKGDPASDQTLTAELSPVDTAREKAARKWLALVDQSDWDASFKATSKTFRDLNTVAMWQEASEQARVPLGQVKNREAIAFDRVNAPPRGYEIVRFLTAFENGKSTIETVTFEREDGELKVVGYFIQ